MTKPLSLSRMAALSAALLAADEEAWATSVDALDYATQLEAKLDALKAALQRRCAQLHEKHAATSATPRAPANDTPAEGEAGADSAEASPSKSTPRGASPSAPLVHAAADAPVAAAPAEGTKATQGGADVVTPLPLAPLASPRSKSDVKPPSRPTSVRDERPESGRKKGDDGSSISLNSSGSGITQKAERSPSTTTLPPTPPVASSGSGIALAASGSIPRQDRPPSVSASPTLLPASTPLPASTAAPEGATAAPEPTPSGWTVAKPASSDTAAAGGPKKGTRFICIETYEAAGPEELSFAKGDSLSFWEADESGWAYGEVQGKRGWFPFSYVAPPDLAAAALAAELMAHSTPMPPPADSASATGATGTPPASLHAQVSHTAVLAASTSAPPAVETTSIVANKNVISNKLSGFLGGKRTDKKSLEEKHILMDLSASQAGAKKEEKRAMLTNFFKMGGGSNSALAEEAKEKEKEVKEVKEKEKPGTKRLLPVPGGGGDKKVEKDKKKGGAHDEPVAFGQPLEKLLQKPDSKKSVRSGKGMTLSYIPAVVSDCIRFLDQPQRLSLEGLFRLSPAKDDFDRIRALWKGMAEPLDLESHTSDPHAVAAVLKSFFNSLPEPVMTYAISEQIFALKDMEKLPVADLKALIGKLPILNKMTVECLFVFLRRVIEYSGVNRMTASNVAIVWGPNLVRARVETPELLMSRQDTLFVECILAHSLEIFPPAPSAPQSAHK